MGRVHCPGPVPELRYAALFSMALAERQWLIREEPRGAARAPGSLKGRFPGGLGEDGVVPGFRVTRPVDWVRPWIQQLLFERRFATL